MAFPVIAVAGLGDLMAFLEHHPEFASYRTAVARYREQYGVMLKLSAGLILLLAAFSAHSAAPAVARNFYCCEGGRICADSLPEQCRGKAYRILDSGGNLLKEIGPPLTAGAEGRAGCRSGTQEGTGRPGQGAAAQPSRPSRRADQPASFCRSRSLTCCGLALPLAAFIT
jgi:hypothetical protein